MTQLKLYQYAAWGLLVLNLSMVAFFFLTKPTPPDRADGQQFRNKAVNILQLDEQQEAAFSKLAMAHAEEMRRLMKSQQDLLKPYFDHLLTENDAVNPDSILLQYQQLEKEKLVVTYQHFEDIKGILKEEQKGNFPKFMEEAIRALLPKRGNGARPPRPD